MTDQIYVRELAGEDMTEAHKLVSAVFDEFVAPLYSKEGIAEFKSFIEPEKLLRRLQANSFMLGAESRGELVGITAVRDWNHVSLPFVTGDQQHRGIARSLLAEALRRCRAVEPDLTQVTVNSSPNAREAYRRMGFTPTSEEQLTNGIRSVPMVLRLSSGNSVTGAA